MALEPSSNGKESPLSSPLFRRDSVLETSDQYVYAPLNDHRKQIRLCSIKPASPGSELTIEIHTVNLADNVERFIGLSYVWGDPKNQVQVSLNGRRHAITSNLHSLLCRLRAIGLRDSLWIDAVCIDQRNKKERTGQIELMGELYTGAKQVLIGLEETAQYSSQPVGNDTLVKATIEGLANGLHLYELDCFLASAAAKGTSEKTSDPFRRLLSSPWFERTWVIQEICLSREAILLCSWGMVSWKSFVQAFRNWNYHRMNKDCCSAFAETLDEDLKTACHAVYCSIESIVLTTENLKHEQQQHLLQLILLYQHLKVTDPKDKFHAFRGLYAPFSNLPPPAADYTKSNESVFTEWAVWILQDTRSLLLLALALRGAHELPSWVPDLSTRPPIEPNLWRGQLGFLQTYACSKGLDASVEYDFPGRLRLRGANIDQVQDVAEAAIDFNETAEYVDLLGKWYNFAIGCADTLHCRQDLDEALCATTIAGCIKDHDGIRKANAMDLAEWKEMLLRLIQHPSLDDAITSSDLMASHIIAVLDRRLFRTCNGRLGVGPKALRSGDSIWLLGNGEAPFILRRTPSAPSEEREHSIVGPAYVHGIMYGEAIGPHLEVQDCLII